jgi:phage tail-like protein
MTNIPVSFHFRVLFEGGSGKPVLTHEPPTHAGTFADRVDTGFYSVTGLEATITPERNASVTEMRAPETAAIAYAPLVLRRAVRDIALSPLTQWVFGWLYKKEEVVLPEIFIELLNDQHLPYMRWRLTEVIPLTWRLGELNAEKSDVLMETIELTYRSLVFVPNKNSPAPLPEVGAKTGRGG